MPDWLKPLAGPLAWAGLFLATISSLLIVVLLPPPLDYWIAPLPLIAVALLAPSLNRRDATGTGTSIAAPQAAALPARAGVPADAQGLLAELEALRHVQKDLVKAKQDAEAAMMSKSEFLATMSHEIRTPLNGIIPLLDIVLSTKLGVDQRDYLITAYKSARELLRIVDDILDYSKIEANKLELETVSLNLREILDAVKRLMEKSAESKGLSLSVAIEPAVRLAVRGDPVRLRQVLTNLVSNAIKFTERGAISIRVSKRGETRTHNEVLFQVQDSGLGIAPEAAEKLFLPFSQADASTTRIHGGTGLGLVICKRIVDLMGGKIGVKSELGKGSVFWFSVPFLKAHGDVASVRTDLSGARALVVSDDAAFNRRLGGFFSSWGVQQLSTNVAAEALAKLRNAAQMGETWAFDLLVIDLASMRGNPVALLRNVTREPALESVRCLFVASGEAPTELQEDQRAALISTGYSESDLRTAAYRLLNVQETISTRGTPQAAIVDISEAELPIDAGAVPVAPLAGHVLLVEDNPVNRQVAQRILGLLGLSLESAENGKEAIDKLDSRNFDLVLMDCQMPVMDGYTATRVRRSREAEGRSTRVPIIAMTANAMAGDREKCLASGMDEYLSKPLNRGLLEQTLRKWLPKTARSREDAGTPAIVRPSAPLPVVAKAEFGTLALGIGTEPVNPLGQRDGAALDQEIVRDLLDVMGEEFTDLVNVYLEDTPKNLALLEQAAARGDKNGLIAPSHSLKSTSANLGAMTLAEIAKRIEHEARGGTLGDPQPVVRDLAREYGRVSAELKHLLARSGA
ncbi:MAG: ATP-binding protein [Tahibacter sp.]